MAIAIYSLPHLDRITSPETALQSYRIALQKDGVTLDLGGTLSAATKDRLDRVSVPVGNTGIMLMLRVKDAPVNVARSLSVFLSLLIWRAAPALGWFGVHTLTIPPPFKLRPLY